MMRLLPIALSAPLLTATPAQAAPLPIPLGEQAGSLQQNLPKRGTSRAQVQRTHGEPTTRHAAVGQPPTTRWDYPGYSVSFENDHVIHAVRHHTPRTNRSTGSNMLIYGHRGARGEAP